MERGFRLIEVHNSDDFIRRIRRIRDQYSKQLINERAQDMRNGIMPGDYIKKKPYPKKYRGYSNLYRIKISDYFRLIYTIIGTSNKKVYLILDFLDHDEYNKLFGYRMS